MAQHFHQPEQQRKRGRDLPHDGPAPRKKAKAEAQPQILQLVLFPEHHQAAS